MIHNWPGGTVVVFIYVLKLQVERLSLTVEESGGGDGEEGRFQAASAEKV